MWGLQFSLEDELDLWEEYAEIELPRAHRLGMRSIRTNLRWDDVEPRNVEPSEYDWSIYDRRLAEYSDAGLDVIVTLVAYPSWATEWQCGGAVLQGMDVEWREFVREAARRYRAPRYNIAGWEIGNEVDGKTKIVEADYDRSPEWGGGQPTVPHGGCWGDRAPAYKEFLREAYEEIKGVDPDVPVLLGGLAYVDLYDYFGYDLMHMDFLDKLLEAGGGAYFDVFSYHWFPDVDPRYQPPGPERHRELMAKLHKHGLRPPVWLTETYRLSDPTPPEGELRQMLFTSRDIVELLAFPELERVYWYGWVDFPPRFKPDPSQWDRGAVRHDHTAKPVVKALPYTIEYTNGIPEDVSTDAVRAIQFRRPREAVTYVIAWPRDEGTADLVVPVPSGSQALVTRFPPDLLLQGECCVHEHLREQSGRIEVSVGQEGVFAAIRTSHGVAPVSAAGAAGTDRVGEVVPGD